MDKNNYKPDGHYEKIIGVFGLRYEVGSQPEKETGQPRPVFSDYDAIVKGLGGIKGYDSRKYKFLSGGSKGVELLAERWCMECAMPFERVKPDVVRNGNRMAFAIRNSAIISRSSDIVIFCDKLDNGALTILSEALALHRKILIIPVK